MIIIKALKMLTLCGFYLFSVWGPAADGCCHLVTLSREKVVTDFWEECFEHTNIKPRSFLWNLLDL